VRGVLSSDTKWAALPVSSGVLTHPFNSTVALNYLQRSVEPLSLLPAVLSSQVCGAVLQWDHDHFSILESDA
jgi:hypothetical protein